MAQYIKSLKRVVQNGDNKALEEYDFAVKAENVIVTTSDGNEETVQDALLQFTEPTTFTLDNSQTNWNVDNKISWQMICDSLENNTIQNYLKAGDEIDIQVGNETLPFFVLGVNTYNGQPKDQFGKSHIDLGCPQMSKVLAILKTYQPTPSDPLNTYFPFGNVSNNNGGIIDSIAYQTFFEKSNFRKVNSDYYKNTLLQMILNIDNDNAAYVKPKILFLDRRFGISEDLLNDLQSLFDKEQNLSSVYSDLVELYQKIPDNIPAPQEEEYEKVIDSATIITDGETTTSVTIKMPDAKEVAYPAKDGEPWHEFYNSAKNFLQKHASSRGTALTMLRYSINLTKNLVLDATGIKTWTAPALAVQGAMINAYDEQEIIDFMSKICTAIVKKDNIIEHSNGYVQVFNSSKVNPFPLFWGLTEYELFGACVLGDKKYSQGQNFQYPIFKNLLVKEKFIGTNKEIQNFATITPVDDSKDELAGCRTKQDTSGNLLCARPIQLPVYDPGANKYTYDTALCFRLQA